MSTRIWKVEVRLTNHPLSEKEDEELEKKIAECAIAMYDVQGRRNGQYNVLWSGRFIKDDIHCEWCGHPRRFTRRKMSVWSSF